LAERRLWMRWGLCNRVEWLPGARDWISHVTGSSAVAAEMDCPLRWEGLPSVPVSSGGGAYRGSGVRTGASLGPFWQPSQPPARLRSGETRCDAVEAMTVTTTSLGKLVVACFPLVIELSHLLALFVPVSMAQRLSSICFLLSRADLARTKGRGLQ
jgi:hypothetical protein